MAEFKMHLASELVTERKTVSYRSLARTQKVHVNTAKCMLYEFYEEQTKRKPGSVYATYLLSGVKRREVVDEDVSMRSSPPPTGSMPVSQHDEVKVNTITLVREEDLEDIRSTYETTSSIHIYSLSPAKIPDLMTLSDLTRSLYTDVFAKEDPLLHNKTYGVVQNPQVRRRKGKRQIVPTAQSKFQPVQEPAKEQPKSQPAAKPAQEKPPALKKESSLSKSLARNETSSRESTPKPALKRDASDIFKAFAKGKTKPKDTPMADTDDGEEDETLFETKPMKRPGEIKKERDDKAAKLRKMMDEDEDEAEVEVKPTKEVDMKEATNEEDVAWSESDTEKPTPAPVETGPKRKRGKRKILKKRTMKDADGYLVTKEEEAWESFSESDNEKPVQAAKIFGGFNKKPPPKKAAAGKKDIMSFFGKK